MSDTQLPPFSEVIDGMTAAPEPPREIEVETASPLPDDGEIPCPECDRTFVTPQGLGRHRSTTHGQTETKGKVECPVDDCPSWVIPSSLGRHLRHVHHIFGGISGVTRTRRGRPPGSKNRKKTLEITTPAPAADNGHTVDKLPPLTAEQITRAAAESLWPEGIPHDMLTALLRWNVQTHYFLAEVSQ